MKFKHWMTKTRAIEVKLQPSTVGTTRIYVEFYWNMFLFRVSAKSLLSHQILLHHESF